MSETMNYFGLKPLFNGVIDEIMRETSKPEIL